MATLRLHVFAPLRRTNTLSSSSSYSSPSSVLLRSSTPFHNPSPPCQRPRPTSPFVRHKSGSGRESAQSVSQRQSAAQSVKTLGTTAGMEIPNDVGLFEQTFVMPTGKNKPSLFLAPRDRLKLEWTRIFQTVAGWVGLIMYKTASKPWVKIRPRETAAIALSLHRKMYTAFAEGDIDTLRTICAEGLLASFRARIASRHHQERYVWRLHRYTSRFARVVSHRAVRLPLDDTAAQRQAIVRIRSVQSLTRYGPDGNPVPGTGKERELDEYVVVQRRVLDGAERPWVVWGTVGESTVEQVRADEKRARGDEG